MGQTPEGRIKAMVKKGLDRFGRHSYRFMPVQTGYGARTLDFIICFRGWFVSIETKAPGKHPTPLQESIITDMQDANGIVFVIDDQASCDAAMKELEALPWLLRQTNTAQVSPEKQKAA